MILSNPEEDQERLFNREILSLGPEEAKAFREAYSKCSTIVNTRKRFDEAVAAADDPNYKLFPTRFRSSIDQRLAFLRPSRIPTVIPVQPPILLPIRDQEADHIIKGVEVVVEAEAEVAAIAAITVIAVTEATEATGATETTGARVLTRILTGEAIHIVVKMLHLFAMETLFFFVPHSPPQ